MNVNEALESLRQRTPWPVARRILKSIKLVPGMGWNKTLEKLSNDIKTTEDKADEIAAALKDHQLCGEKLSSFYEFDDTDMISIREKLGALTPAESVFLGSFPITVSERDLKAAPPGLTLVAIVKEDRGLAAVFSSARVTSVREPINIDTLRKEVAEELDEYEEIIGLKTVRFQAFDVIWVPDTGNTIDVRVDFPDGSLSEVAIAARKILVAEFERLTALKAPEPINLFPLIDKMYNDRKEGTVVELAFGTTTASLKHEKMRRRKLDLRDEAYHQGGKAALVTPIEPFKVSILWNRPIEKKLASEPELSLSSNSRAAGAVNPVLDRVVIRRCMGNDDYDYVLSRISYHLGR